MKEAITSVQVNEYARKRWSPRAFKRTPVEKEKLVAVLEAARWSASAMNEQPWRFIIGVNRDESWKRIFECLAEGNRLWAGDVPVLILAIGKTTFSHDGSPSTIYAYDTGQAAAHLSLEAMHQGLHVHQMGGFDAEKTLALFSIPDGFHPLTVIAVGYLDEPSKLPLNLQKRESAPRTRKPLEDLVFSGTFGNSAGLNL